MKRTYFDVAVVGAGMFGSAAAKYLSKDASRVALIGPDEPINKHEASSQKSFGSYYDQARITRRLGWDEVWSVTDSRSLNRFRDIEADSNIPFFYEQGSLVLMAKTIASRTELMLRQCHEANIPVHRMNSEDIKDRWPYLKPPQLSGGVEGLFEEQMAGYLNPRRLVAAQQCLFERAGGSILRGNVHHVVKNKQSNLWQLTVSQQGQSHDIYAKHILIAAGAFVNHNGILPDGHQLDLHAFTEPNLLFEVDEKDRHTFQKMPTTITVDPDDVGNKNVSIYLLPPIQYPDGKWYIRIGPGMQPIVSQLDSHESMRSWYIQQQITQEQRTFLADMLQMLMPDFKAKSIKEACCIVEKTPSHHPYIGQINDDCSLNVVVGGNGHGARGSDEIGRLAASVVLEKKWDFPIPQNHFKPVVIESRKTGPMKMLCKPPFGLC